MATMGRGKKYQPEQVVHLLRTIEAAVADGETVEQACRDAGIVEPTYYRWRNQFGNLQVDQAKRLKELEQENAKLRRLVAELSLDKLLLKDIISGNL
jgi:putative transposase